MGSFLSSSSAADDEDDGYRPPAERRRTRFLPEPAAVLTDSDAAAFDPTADKYDYLIVFSADRPKKKKDEDAKDMKWTELEEIWFQAIPGEEDKKTKGVTLLRSVWEDKIVGESAPKDAVETLIRDHIIDVLSRRSGLQLKLSLSSSRTQQFCQVRAPMSLLERKADALDYKLKFKGEIDPGPEFWQRSDGRDYVELKEEQTLYAKNQANEILSELYRHGKIGPHDMAVFDDEEPTKKHWSRRVHAIERIVDRVPVTNEFPAYAAYDANARERHLYEEYQSVRGRTFFLAKDRLYLTKRIVDEVFDFGVLVEKSLVQLVTALHDANYGEMPTSDWFLKRWVFFWQAESDRVGAPYITHSAITKNKRCPWLLRPWAQPLMEIRAYFGEKIALYFAWLGFYGYYLIYPAIVGLICMVYVVLSGTSDETVGLHPEQFVMGIFLVCWSAFYKERWDVESQYCALKWGTVNFEEEEVDRPQFLGDKENPRRISPVTNQMVTYYPPHKRAATQRRSIIVIIVFIVALVVCIVFIFELEYLMLLQGGILASATAAVGLLQAVLIQVMSQIYGAIALQMNKDENYRTQTNYENQLILKKFLFEIFNNYSALAITAYFKGVYFQCTSGVSKQNCLGDLKSLLESIFGTRFALALVSAFKDQIQQVVNVVVPQSAPPPEDDEDDDEEDAADQVPVEAERFETELNLDEYEGTFDDYAEIVLQMGLVTMFSLGWYVVPCLAILEVLLQIRVDAFKLSAQARRPDPTPAESVGSWGVLMESMGLLAVYANAGIIVFTTRSFSRYTFLQKLLIFFALEQVALVLKFATHAIIDDVPTHLSELKRRNDHVVNRHKIAVFDDDDDDEDGPGKGADATEANLARGAVDTDLLSVAKRSEKLTPFNMRRLDYLRRKLLGVDNDLALERQNYKTATKAEVFRPEFGVSYSRKNPDLALGLLTITVVEIIGVGTVDDAIDDPRNIRVIAHVRHDDDPNISVGPPPQVSKAGKKPRSGRGEDVDHGERILVDHLFSLAPIKSIHAHVRFEVMEDKSASFDPSLSAGRPRQRRRATAKLALNDLEDQQPHKNLELAVTLPRDIVDNYTSDDDEALPPTGPRLKLHAQFQYSKVVPIKRKIIELLDEQKLLHMDITRLQLGEEVENEDRWKFPDSAELPDAKEEDDEDDLPNA